MHVHNNYTELIGNTTMLRLHHIERVYQTNGQIIAKRLNFNPLSSLYDQLTLARIESL